jgi:hypothetical protein
MGVSGQCRHTRHVLRQLRDLQRRQLLPADLRVACGKSDDDDVVVATHSLLLAAVSPVLRTYLESVNGGDEADFVLIVPDVDADDLRIFLEYLVANSEQVYDDAHLPAIKRVCETFDIDCQGANHLSVSGKISHQILQC